MMKKSAYIKDITCTVKKNFSRFIAIVAMAALGTGVFTGFTAGCMDVFDSADRFYDRQSTYDIKIASTLGLTQKDLEALSQVAGVNKAYADYSMDVKLKQNGESLLVANLSTLDPEGMNEPYVLEGRLPEKAGQIAVTERFLHDTGLKLGDNITLEAVENAEKDETAEETTAITDSSIEEDSLETGDLEVSVEDDTQEPKLAVSEYEITALVLSPLDISSPEEGLANSSFSSSSSDYMMFAVKGCIDSDIITTIYLTVDDAKEQDTYSEKYRALVEGVASNIKGTLVEERQQARYDQVVGEANQRLADAEKKLADKMAEADRKLADAQIEINDGWDSYQEGLAEVEENEAKLADGQEALTKARKSADEKFLSAQKELDTNRAKLEEGEAGLNREEASAFKEFAAYEQQIAESRKELDQKKAEAKAGLSGTVAALPKEARAIWNSGETQSVWADMVAKGKAAAPYLLAAEQGGTPTSGQTEAYNQAMAKLQEATQKLAGYFVMGGSPLTEEQVKAFPALAVQQGTLDYSQGLLDENSSTLAAKKEGALKQISAARKEIEEGKAKLAQGQEELDTKKAEARQQLDEKQAELEDGRKKLEDARKELKEAEAELIDGQKELDDNIAEYQKSIAEAKQKIADGKAEVADIGEAKWYVWDRYDNDSFSGLDNDISFIEAVTKAFPFIFFLVAILVCLTTMTRMVEEDRSLIGTYKSLGYAKHQISMKYLIYATLACCVGGILGTVLGFWGLPEVIRIIAHRLYVIPDYKLSFYPVYGLGSFGLFLFGIVGATVFSCAEMLHKRPAELMRPKPPKEGSRILLERIPFIWKRLKFLNKVTCRNLFRYKKRALMTIIGILGCMMLIVLGFGVRDTVGGLMSDQFDKVTVYDAVVVTDDLTTEERDQLQEEWKASGMVKDGLQLQISTLTLWKGSRSVEIAVMVIPDGTDLSPYVHLRQLSTGKSRGLPPEGLVVTQNAAKQLKIEDGDRVSLQNEDNVEYDFPVDFVTVNNAGNYIYISESRYQAAFGDYDGSAYLLNLEERDDRESWLGKLSEDERILTVSSSQHLRDAFGDMKKIVNMVVYVLIGMSAVLAFTVLFTLSNINVSERERELATMKVLGFQPNEVASYINKETIILTLIGILLGMPAGYGVTYGILANVSIADTAFNVRVSFFAYLAAAVLTMVFTLLVNRITDKALRRINMVEALKSVE
ncbi:MAG TPA: FtsX-like permease family protein [Clostridiales bacterium]|nr:FtsX-like permease family protein [Clostridiales bacterium]